MLKILQYLLQDFQPVCDHFVELGIIGLNHFFEELQDSMKDFALYTHVGNVITRNFEINLLRVIILNFGFSVVKSWVIKPPLLDFGMNLCLHLMKRLKNVFIFFPWV